MPETSDHDATLHKDTFPLDGFRGILHYAQEVYAQEQTALQNAQPGIWPGHSPAYFAVMALQDELARVQRFRAEAAAPSPQTERCHCHLAPLWALRAILDRAGQGAVELPAEDVSSVLGALLEHCHRAI